MAIMINRFGRFAIQDISFSSNVITAGESTDYSIFITNRTGKKITKLIITMRLCYKDRDGVVRYSETQKVYGQEPLSSSIGIWDAGKTIELRGTFQLKVRGNRLDIDSRVLPIYSAEEMGFDGDFDVGLMLDIKSDVPYNTGNGIINEDTFYNLRGSEGQYLTIINRRINPRITVFAAERSTGERFDDEGENVISTFAVSGGAMSELYLHAINTSKTEPEVQVNLHNLIMDAISPDGVTTTITNTFAKDSDWKLALYYGDQYEMATANITLSKAFANVHLSGVPTGGVCFGGFSKSTEGNPLFQCYYPSAFYEGIEGISRFSADEVAIGRWIDGKRIYRRVFEGSIIAGGIKTFEAIPDMETLVGISGMMKWTTSNVWVPLVYSAGNTTYNTVSADANGKVSVTGVNASTFFVIVDYTKIVEVVSE